MLQIVRDNKALEKNVAKLSYRVIDKLLYFDDNKKRFYLYILIALKIKIFKLAYNEIRYSRYA